MIALVKGLLGSIERPWLRVLGAVGLAALASLCSVALMGTAAWLLSRAAEHPPVMYLTAAATLVRAFGIGRGAARYAERLVGHELGLRLQSALRLQTYTALARTTLLGRRRGDLLTRVVADVDAVLDIVVRVLVPLASGVFVIGATTIILGTFSWPYALALLATAVVAGVVAPWWGARLSARADAAALPARGELANVVHEAARAATDLVAYGAVDAVAARVAEADARLRDADARAAWTRGLATAIQVLAAGTAVIAGLLIGAPAVAAGDLDRTMLAVLTLTPLALHEVFADFTKAAQTMTRASAAFRRVREVLNAEPVGRGDLTDRGAGTPTTSSSAGPDSRIRPAPAPEADDSDGTISTPTTTPATRTPPSADHSAPPTSGEATTSTSPSPQDPPRLVVTDLEIGWPGAPALASGICFDVGPGERVALVGPSGVGKTTLAATLLGLIPARGGTIEVGGSVGYLAQDAHVFATTVAENVRIGNREAADAEVADALARARLNLDPARVVGELGTALSGGEARRLALSRLLVGNRQVLILDEPTEHLDPATASALMDDIWATTADRAVLVITHDADVVARCDRVVELSAGPHRRQGGLRQSELA